MKANRQKAPLTHPKLSGPPGNSDTRGGSGEPRILLIVLVQCCPHGSPPHRGGFRKSKLQALGRVAPNQRAAEEESSLLPLYPARDLGGRGGGRELQSTSYGYNACPKDGNPMILRRRPRPAASHRPPVVVHCTTGWTLDRQITNRNYGSSSSSDHPVSTYSGEVVSCCWKD